MYEMASIYLRRYLLLDEAKFRFKSGISVVGGDNRVGKSLLFSGLDPLLYGGEANYKHPAGSTLDFSFRRSVGESKVNYKVGAKTAKSSKFSIFQDGEDLTPHTIRDGKQLIGEAWALPYDLFHSTVSLQGVRTHPLATGTPAKRSEWLANVLDLTSIYDAYGNEVSSRLEELTVKKTQLLVLEQEVEELVQPEIRVTRSRALTAKGSLPKLKKTLAGIPSELDKLSLEVAELNSAIKCPPKPSPPNKTVKQLQSIRDRYVLKVAEVKERLDSYLEYQTIIDELERSKKSIGTVTGTELKARENDYHEMRDELDAHRELVASYNEQAAARDSKDYWRDNLSPRCKSLAEAQSRGAELRARVSMLRKTRDAYLKVAGKKVCPTCSSTLSPKGIKSNIARVEAEGKKLVARLSSLKDEVTYWEAFSQTLLPDPGKCGTTEKEARDLKGWLSVAAKQVELRGSLPTKFNVRETVTESYLAKCQRKLDGVTSALTMRMAYDKHSSNLSAATMRLSKNQIRSRLREASKRLVDKQSLLKEVTANIIEANSMLSRRKDDVALAKMNRAQRLRLTDKVNALKEATADIKALKALQQAFGNTGLRLIQLQESANVLETKLTELSSLFFDDPYTFRVHIAPRKLDIMIERNGIEGSLATLSGSEQRSWALLCAMALLHILPDRLRCDTIILDEVEANMSKRSRDRYTIDVIPELRTLIRKIVVVTPLVSGELKLSPDHDYRVVKTETRGRYSSRLTEV